MPERGEHTFQCTVDGCLRTFDSAHGRGSHFGSSHTVAEKKRALLEEINRLAVVLGKTPSCREMNAEGHFGRSVYEKYFGSWNNALSEAGQTPTQLERIPDDLLIDELQRVATELGTVPAKRDMTTHGNYGYTAYQERFGWNTAVRIAGYEPQHTPGVRPGDIYYGPNWKAARSAVIARDNNQCRVCGASGDGLIRSSPDVHHIKRARRFGAHDRDVDTDYSAMNDLSNLIALCASCHKIFEFMWPDASPETFARRAQHVFERRNGLTMHDYPLSSD